MKKVIFISLLAFFALSLNTAFAQNDSIYVMRNGSVIWKYKFSDIDSIIYYNPDNINIPDTPIDTGTLITGTFTDSRDGYEYSWVQIGSQIWMAENLKYLPSVVGPGTGSSSEAYYYVYGYDGTDVEEAKATENYATYGVLYNWTAAMAGAGSSNSIPSGVQGICPEGWHLPSDAEWQQLEMYLGMSETDANSTGLRGTVEGGKLKEAGYDHWQSPNEGANNESGFTALPGGGRGSYGNFHHIGQIGYWWSSTEKGTNDAWYRYLYFNNSNVTRNYYYSESGFSVRCVRD